MVKQSKDYIKKQKSRYLKWGIIWTVAVLAVYITGLLVVKTRNNYFTLVAGLLVLPLALNLTRFFAFNRFKDGDHASAEELEAMKGSYSLFHSAIIPDTRTTVLFEHVIVTARSVYFLTKSKEVLEKNKIWLENRLSSKGIPLKNIHFSYIEGANAVKNAAAKIEKDACYTSGYLEQYTQIIQGMLM